MRGRGIDFEHRFKTSRWAEDLLIAALSCEKTGMIAKRFGLSRIRAPVELAQVEATGIKEPDLIVFSDASLSPRERKILRDTDLEILDRTHLCEHDYEFVLQKALATIEVEFSPYRAAEMTGRHWAPKDPDAWDRRPLKHAKPPTAPNIFVKEEDLAPLDAWQRVNGVPIVIAHIFDQEAFSYPLTPLLKFARRLKKLDGEAQRKIQCTSGIFRKIETYNRIDAQGAAEQKPVFCITPAAAAKLGDVKDVRVKGQHGVSASKKYVAHVLFEGGRLILEEQFLKLLAQLRMA